MKISLVTAVYNAELTITDTLKSVAEQTYPFVEHLLIDGKSNDQTVKIIEKNRHANLVLHSEPDQGIYDAMNKGLRLATGEIIGLINADDFYASADVLSKVAAVFADSSVEACYGDLCYVKQFDTSIIVRYWKSQDFQKGSFAKGWAPPHPTFFVRRAVYERLGGFDLSYKIAADVELMMRFLEVHQIKAKHIPEVFVKMRLGGTTNKSFSNIWKQNKEVLRALKSHGLQGSLLKFIVHKLLSRGMQFLFKPRR